MSSRWSPEEATRFLQSRELFGVRPGLDRMRILLSALGAPQGAFRTIHVVGTNGKSSTTRYAAEILTATGVRSGAYVSPHLVDFCERVLLPSADGIAEVDRQELADAIATTADAAARIEASHGPGFAATQFELMTAAAFVLFARAAVDVAVIEAGLGGRLDATNVLAKDGVCVLTGIGIDHAQWLGSDPVAIAGEKLAVLGRGGALVIPDNLEGEIEGLATRVSAENGARLVKVGPIAAGQVAMKAAGGFQRTNLALACGAVEMVLGTEVPAEVQSSVAAEVEVPGRLQLVMKDPVTIIDAAHNPDGMRTLREELIALGFASGVTLVFGALADKDIEGMLGAMLPSVERLFITELAVDRSASGADIAAVAERLGLRDVSREPTSAVALEAARRAAGPHGVVVATGSVHVAGELLAGSRSRVVSGL